MGADYRPEAKHLLLTTRSSILQDAKILAGGGRQIFIVLHRTFSRGTSHELWLLNSLIGLQRPQRPGNPPRVPTLSLFFFTYSLLLPGQTFRVPNAGNPGLGT